MGEPTIASGLHIIVDAPLERLLATQRSSEWCREPVQTGQFRDGFATLARSVDPEWGRVGSAPFAARLSVGELGARSFWLWADPMFIEIRRDHGRARFGSDTDADSSQLAALFDAAAAVAAGRGASLMQSPEPGRWLFRAPRLLDVVCAGPVQLSHADLYSHRPEGPDRRWIDGLLGEVQMALHGVLPEAPGAALPNALWLSGGGTLPARPRSAPTARLVTDSPSARSLWEWAGGEVVSGSVWSRQLGCDQVVYVDPGLGEAVRAASCDHWLAEQLPAAIEGARRRKFGQLRLSGGDGRSARFVGRKRWRWLRWPPTLTASA